MNKEAIRLTLARKLKRDASLLASGSAPRGKGELSSLCLAYPRSPNFNAR